MFHVHYSLARAAYPTVVCAVLVALSGCNASERDADPVFEADAAAPIMADVAMTDSSDVAADAAVFSPDAGDLAVDDIGPADVLQAPDLAMSSDVIDVLDSSVPLDVAAEDSDVREIPSTGCGVGADRTAVGTSASVLDLLNACELGCDDFTCLNECLHAEVSTDCGQCFAVLAGCHDTACNACAGSDIACLNTCRYAICGQAFEQCAFPDGDPNRPYERASIRVVNLSPDTTVDVYLQAGRLLAADVPPRGVRSVSVDAGHSAFELRRAGDAADADPLLTVAPGFYGYGPNTHAFIAVFGSQNNVGESLNGAFIYEDESPISSVRYRIIGAMTTGQVDIWEVGTPGAYAQIYYNLTFGSVGRDKELRPGQMTFALDPDQNRTTRDLRFPSFPLVGGQQITLWFANTIDGAPYLLLTYLHGGHRVMRPR